MLNINSMFSSLALNLNDFSLPNSKYELCKFGFRDIFLFGMSPI